MPALLHWPGWPRRKPRQRCLSRAWTAAPPAAPTAVNQRFSDTYAYGDLKLQFVFSCYLIKHGDEYILWDVGHAITTPNVAPKVSLVDPVGPE